jgi:hypothetical protein
MSPVPFDFLYPNTGIAKKSFQTFVTDRFHVAMADFDKAKPGSLRHLFCLRGRFLPLLQSNQPLRFQLIRFGSKVAFDRADLISLTFPRG